MPPKALGLVPLAVSESLLAEARLALFRLVIQDALRRGARDYNLSLLLMKYFFWIDQQVSSVDEGVLSGVVRDVEANWARSVIDDEKASFNLIIEQEMTRVSHLVGKPELIRDKDDYQYRVRPLYYGAGYTNPANFLEKMVLHNMLGKFPIWIHEDLAKLLNKAASILDRWTPGLAAGTTQEIRGVLGLQIRTIAGSTSLSNHAFGLAIDIDAYSNPHVVNRNVIEVFNWAAVRGGVTFDFAKMILTEAERGHKGYNVDDVVEVYSRAHQASDAVRSWLQTHLPRYRELTAQVQAAEKELGLTRVKSTTRLEDRAHAAEGAKNRIAKQRELKSPDKVCQPLSDESPEGVAARRVQTALRQIAADEHLRRVQAVYENISDTRYIETWEKRGVLTVPLYLVAALVGILALRWGEQYEQSKDAMHFELVNKDGRSYIPPDAPLARKEKPRTLGRLVEEAFGRGRLRLPMPTLLQTERHRR